MLSSVWHDPATDCEPVYPTSSDEIVRMSIGTHPVEFGQSVWIAYQEFDEAGDLIYPTQSEELGREQTPNPLHYVQCNWVRNSGGNSYWTGRIGQFSDGTKRVIYNIFARQAHHKLTVSNPDFFEFEIREQVDWDPAGPGNPPLWSSGAKEGVGTALNSDSKVWFSHSEGVVNEIYYPQLDKPNTRDFQFLVLDENGKFNNPRHMSSTVRYLDASGPLGPEDAPRAPAFRITNGDVPQGEPGAGRYELSYDLASDPTEDSVLMRVTYTPLQDVAKGYRVFALLNPHMNNSGWRDHCKRVTYAGRVMYVASDEGVYCAMAVSAPVGKHGCGFVGKHDGWKDLLENGDLTFGYTGAAGGNVAIIMELELTEARPTATVTLSFGRTESEALERANRTVAKDFSVVLEQFAYEWNGYIQGLETTGKLAAITAEVSPEVKRLGYASALVLRAKEDKTYPGAVIASPSIPWGDCTTDSNIGGYHLVWPRDLYNVGTAALAVGDYGLAARIVQYFDHTQQEDNHSFPQNTWIDGTPYWPNEQLDETAYPIILAWRLKQLGKLHLTGNPDVFGTLVAGAAGFLNGYNDTWTQDRWEEVEGRSPFTVAVVVAALVVAAKWAEERGQHGLKEAWLSKAKDFAVNDLRDCYLDRHGQQYYARIYNPWHGWFSKFMDVIDGGFLELVRLGLKAPQNPKIASSLKVVDSCIKKQLNGHAYYLRYGRVDKQDGPGMDTYGEKDEGQCWTGDGSGRGRCWPFLSGERGHYDLLAGNTAGAQSALAAMVASANAGGMLPEQVWDAGTIQDDHGNWLVTGKGTKSATPLGWTHGEFLKLLRSLSDKKVFDWLAEVEQFAQSTDGDGGSIYDT